MIKFAVIGFGHIGKRHASMVKQNPNADLVGIVDLDRNRHSEAKELHSGVTFYESLDDFIEKDKSNADVVSICTPNGVHASIALRLIDAGYHVVIEKPMALKRSDCEEIIFKSLKHSKSVFVVKQNRYSPPSKWLKEVVDKKIIGEVLMVQINCYWNRDERYYKPGNWKGSRAMDGGTLFTQFSHFIDIMYWVFGDITKIQGRFANFTHNNSIEFEDSGFVTFDFVKGGMGSLAYSTSCWDRNMESSMMVVGTKGWLKIGGQYLNEIEYCHIENYEMPELEETNPPNDYGPYKGSAANHHYVINNVVDTLMGKGAIDTNALEGLKVVEIIERIYDQKSVTLK